MKRVLRDKTPIEMVEEEIESSTQIEASDNILYEVVPYKDEDKGTDLGYFHNYREAVEMGNEYFPDGYDIEEIDMDERADIDDFWEEVERKDVQDSDGFWTDYTLYHNVVTDQWATVFGDKDIYTPEQGYFDMEFDSESEARDFFYDYEGLVDED